jgi:hypothetical protein
MTQTPDITQEAVERLAQEYDQRVEMFDGVMDATPESVRNLRKGRGNLTRRMHVDTAATLRALAARLAEVESHLKTALDREAATCARYDAKLDAAEAKLEKAVETLANLIMHIPDYADTMWIDAEVTLAELKENTDEKR